MRAASIVAILVVLSSPALAQTQGEPEKSGTKLEAFVAQSGAVIIKGFKHIGYVHTGLAAVNVEAREFINAGTGKREYGVTIQVNEYSPREREETTYIDFDEIDSLIKGLDYIGRIDQSATRLGKFQADYRTRGDLTISTFNAADNSLSVAVQAGRVVQATAYFPIAELERIKELVVQAKATLDSIRK
jgi:hypothetical protein